ncbi:hypothetical protein PGO_072880 [Plasmodium gonderi]|uniref:Uncharacterized protein n=1 Tax=Plasmodium gonderi TaxID=77519 RepID=A0A1Y1JIT7_PLAGO|nr:hypothetical protein PGO_072880 [Plasmodium gonderi]GAW80373.1 hypothetical protein PGO_072880 [Plasmodium gonderi]
MKISHHKSTSNDIFLNEKKNVEPIKQFVEVKNDLNNQSDFSSEFEFNFKKHITDSFEAKNKGLFKLPLGNKINHKPDFINYSQSIADNEYSKRFSGNNHRNNELTEPEHATQTKKGKHCESKDEIIAKLKKDIIILTNQFEKKLSKIENVQKDNFQLEQIYKNKYYLDIKKEKSKTIEIYNKNKELLKEIYYYNQFLQELKKKNSCLLRNILTLVEHFGPIENIKPVFSNVKDISSLIESVEHKCTPKNTCKSKEKSENIKGYNSENIKNENKKRKKKGSLKKIQRTATPFHKNNKTATICSRGRKQDEIQKVCSNKEIYFRNRSLLKHYERTNNENDIKNNPRMNQSSFGHDNSLRKRRNVSLGNRQTGNNACSKKMRNVTNFTIRLKNVTTENSDNILHLLRKTRKIKYLLRNSLDIRYAKASYYPNDNTSDDRNNYEPFKQNIPRECVLRRDSKMPIMHSSLFKREHIA